MNNGSRKDNPRVVREVIADGAARVIAGGGEGSNAVVNAPLARTSRMAANAMAAL